MNTKTKAFRAKPESRISSFCAPEGIFDMIRKHNIASCLAVLALVAVAVSCASTGRQPVDAKASNPVWPPASDEARVVYLRSLHGPADIGQSPSFFTRVGHWVT